MSHIHQPRNHIRHANRAGGFGGFKGGETPKTTPETPTSTEPAALSPSETPASTPSAAPAPSSASPSAPESSSSPTTSSTSSTTTTTSTTTHPSIPITTTASGSALHDNITKVVTHIASVTTPGAAAAAATSSSPAVNTTSAMVAPVIGGVAGGILGLTLIIFAITWFMRRRRPTEDAINFDPGTFRRSAMLMTDPPTHQETVERGYNPATPPAMVERRPIYTQASFDNTVARLPGSVLAITAGPNVSSPVSAYDHHSWGAPNAAPVPVLTRNTSGSSAHSAHSAAGTPQYAGYPALPIRQNSMRNGQLAPPQNETEYLDLERGTSVTPYQAEQYVEISKRLNTEVPRGLDTPTVSQIVAEKMDLPPLPPTEDDPFADDDAKEEQAQEVDALPMVQDMSFPAPPSPVHTSSSRYARDSQPPTLPRSVTSAYLSDSAPGTPGAGQTVFVGAQSPMGSSRFPVTPSPLASSFSVPSPPAAAVSFPAEHAQARPEAKKRQTVYSTVYDEEDAYGGM
ncbi:hypothetical protein B0H14DRAFT_2873776 [Mycena olivaceomarginata]|nr:hypothetical protein B0H14DRAFT_2873776 [Mycena olivaceomarginata]